MKQFRVDAVIERDGLVCQYCGRAVVKGQTAGGGGLVIEHVEGRAEDTSNLCVSCRSCNSTKNRRTASEWLADTSDEIAALVRLYDRRARIAALLNKLGKEVNQHEA